MIQLTTTNICCIVTRAQLACAELYQCLVDRLSQGDKINKKGEKTKLIFLNDQINILEKYSSNNLAFANVPINIYPVSTTIIMIGSNTVITLTNATVSSIIAAIIAQGYNCSLVGMCNENNTAVFNISNTNSTPLSCYVTVAVSGITQQDTVFNLNAPYISDENAYELISCICTATKNVSNDQFADLDGSTITH